MNNCEVVDSYAGGESFKYCRTHKTEPKDCPGAAKPIELDIGDDRRPEVNYFEEEFKVGDRVKVKTSGPAACYLNNQVFTIDRMFPDWDIVAFEETSYHAYVKELEHAD